MYLEIDGDLFGIHEVELEDETSESILIGGFILIGVGGESEVQERLRDWTVRSIGIQLHDCHCRSLPTDSFAIEVLNEDDGCQY